MLSLLPSDSDSRPSQAHDIRPRLLIVDDEEGPRQSLKIVFKNDYQVLVASNGIDAIAMAKRQAVDVAVLDILMQGMSGVELLAELKGIDPYIEVIMLTAYETLETTRHALRYGASDYLDKPFDILTMRAAVARAAHKRHTSLGIQTSQKQLEVLQHEIQVERIQQEMARTKGEIYASVLHDINSPLTVIACFVELINRSMKNATRVEGKQLENIKDDFKQLQAQVSHCFEISRRYLSFLNASEHKTASVSVQQTLVDLKCLLTRHPGAHGHELIIDELSPDVIVEINGTDLLQILLNLTINAFQSTDTPHRVEVHSRCLLEPLPLDQWVDGPRERFINRDGFLNHSPLVAVTVCDNGPGIAPGVVAKMFDQHVTTKKPGSGTGLGLSIVKRLLKEANGALHLRTTIGGGSTFTVFLQVAGSTDVELHSSLSH
ncbi:MAG: Response regulator receiver sensor signal transduction histidine kinase [Chthoniobacteraceae bacterium]|nr:Response regulator receiver sensor signal transduction histidine kinase [Chthoniobacteraceae bacterium]